MSSYVSASLRRLVAARAGGVCEYCLIHEDDTFLGCQVEHVISEKHDGRTEEANLAYACVFCNQYKGSDIASLSPITGRLVRFFNPRTDRWSEHVRLIGARIVPTTEIGQATEHILSFNDPDRRLERQELIAAGRYPSEAARKIMASQ